ncbi:hypothetical protein IMSAG049_01491 [Clostridiales bacterium]|nr:hypothetical protein IMSAG049_01491 [Clostridiales bacterium]
MELFLTIMSKLVVLTIYIAIGYAASKFKILSEEFTGGIVKLLLFISLPALILNIFLTSFDRNMISQGLAMLIISFGLYIISTPIGYLTAKLMRLRRNQIGVTAFAITFPNYTFIGIPVLTSILGESVLMNASFGNLACSISVYTIGMLTISKFGTETGGKSGIKMMADRMIRMPVNYALLGGLLLALLNVQPPKPITDTLTGLANLTTPMAMIYIGATLTKIDPKEILGDWRVYVTAGMRLLVMPLFVYFVGRLFINDAMFLNTIVIGAAIPTASFCALFAREYGGDDVLASKYIFISTLLCLVTIPLIYIIIV